MKEGTKENPVYATWNIELNADCPHCKEEYIDLTQIEEFWHHTELEAGDFNKKELITCPKCLKDFYIITQF